MDLTFHTEKGRFNYRVGAVIIQDGKILLMKNSMAPYYYTVGGRVQYDETTEEAVRREVWEELGIKMEIDRPLFLHENFFEDAYSGGHFHEIAVYYLMKDTPALSRIECRSVTELGVNESIHWIPLDQLEQIEALPKSIFDQINNLPSSLKLIVERN